MRKKIIAVLLACMMAASVVPMSVSASGGDDTGSGQVDQLNAIVEIDSSADLVSAIKNQKDDQTWVFTKADTYDVKNTEDGSAGNYSVPNDVYGYPFAFPIYADNITITKAEGVGDVTITSSYTPTETSGGNWHDQNFITIYGTGVKIEGVKLQANRNEYYGTCNKVIELTGNAKDFTLSNVDIIPLDNGSGRSFGGSIYFSVTDAGNTTIQNVTMDAWISASNVTNGTIAIDGLTQDFSNSEYAGYSYNDAYSWNPTVNGAYSGITVSNYTVIVDPKTNLAKQIFTDKLRDGTTVQLKSGNYQVDEPISVSKEITLDGNDSTITGAFASWSDVAPDRNLISFNTGSEGSVIKDITLKANENTRNLLNFYETNNVTIEGNVILDHTNAHTGAPMIVNASDVNVEGNLEMITGTQSWYAINVDSKDKTAKLNFVSGEVTLTDTSGNSLPLVLTEDAESTVTDTIGVLAASITADGTSIFYDNLQDAVTAAEANAETSGSEVTITVLRSDEEATFNYEGDVKFELAEGVESPILTDEESETKYEVSKDGTLVEVEDPGTDEPGTEEPVVEKYTAIINGTPYEYKEGDTVSLYTPLYTYDGRRFVYWVGNVEFDNAYSPSTSFTMPAGDVEVKAVYTYISYTPVEPDVPSYTPVKPVEPDVPEIEWVQKDGNTYLYIDDEMITGWYQDEETEKWYWFDEETGVMSDDCWEKIDGVWYLFDEDGIMLTGWQKVDGKWYYLKPWGGMATGWQLIDSVWYYLRGDGSMAANAWVQSGGYWYYLTGSGEMATNKWVEWKGDWYYLYSSGIMATNTTIDGCYIDSNGIWRA